MNWQPDRPGPGGRLRAQFNFLGIEALAALQVGFGPQHLYLDPAP